MARAVSEARGARTSRPTLAAGTPPMEIATPTEKIGYFGFVLPKSNEFNSQLLTVFLQPITVCWLSSD